MKKINPSRISVDEFARLHSTEEIEILLAKLKAAREERKSSTEEAKFRAIQEFLDSNEQEVTGLDILRWVERMRPLLRRMAARDRGFVHPRDPSLFWIGRGRRPQWVTDCLNAGYTLAQLSRTPPPPPEVSPTITDPLTGKTWSGRGRPPTWVKALRERQAEQQAATQARRRAKP